MSWILCNVVARPSPIGMYITCHTSVHMCSIRFLPGDASHANSLMRNSLNNCTHVVDVASVLVEVFVQHAAIFWASSEASMTPPACHRISQDLRWGLLVLPKKRFLVSKDCCSASSLSNFVAFLEMVTHSVFGVSSKMGTMSAAVGVVIC